MGFIYYLNYSLFFIFYYSLFSFNYSSFSTLFPLISVSLSFSPIFSPFFSSLSFTSLRLLNYISRSTVSIGVAADINGFEKSNKCYNVGVNWRERRASIPANITALASIDDRDNEGEEEEDDDD